MDHCAIFSFVFPRLGGPWRNDAAVEVDQAHAVRLVSSDSPGARLSAFVALAVKLAGRFWLGYELCDAVRAVPAEQIDRVGDGRHERGLRSKSWCSRTT